MDSFKHKKSRETKAAVTKLGNAFFARTMTKLDAESGSISDVSEEEGVEKQSSSIVRNLALHEKHLEELKRRKEMLNYAR